ncbi:MAG: superoxide dismutase [Anaerolineae bacterium]|nr:superoxide dismutase [Anaerolineae bacterium]
MKILALEKEIPGIDDGAFDPHLKSEALKVWELHQAGVLREIYFRDDQTTAVLVLECAGVEEAGAVLDTLPLVKAGLIAFDVIPLRPYPGFARLFAQDGLNQ